MSGVLHRLRGMVQMVSDLVFDDDGNATCKGVSDDDEEDSYSPTVGYHFGFYSRPSNARGFILKADGHGNTSFLLGFRDKQYEMTLSRGEVGVQNEFGASILLDKNGVVNLNGSDYALIKDTLLTDVGNLLKCINAVLQSNCVNGAPLLGMTAAAADIGSDPAALATNVLEIPRLVTKLNVVANYKSTKGKFG